MFTEQRLEQWLHGDEPYMVEIRRALADTLWCKLPGLSHLVKVPRRITWPLHVYRACVGSCSGPACEVSVAPFLALVVESTAGSINRAWARIARPTTARTAAVESVWVTRPVRQRARRAGTVRGRGWKECAPTAPTPFHGAIHTACPFSCQRDWSNRVHETGAGSCPTTSTCRGPRRTPKRRTDCAVDLQKRGGVAQILIEGEGPQYLGKRPRPAATPI